MCAIQISHHEYPKISLRTSSCHPSQSTAEGHCHCTSSSQGDHQDYTMHQRESLVPWHWQTCWRCSQIMHSLPSIVPRTYMVWTSSAYFHSSWTVELLCRWLCWSFSIRQLSTRVRDEYSHLVEIVPSASAKLVLPKLEEIFLHQGILATVKTDNGPPFKGEEFANFMSTFEASGEA